jgi:hypothetical protein
VRADSQATEAKEPTEQHGAPTSFCPPAQSATGLARSRASRNDGPSRARRHLVGLVELAHPGTTSRTLGHPGSRSRRLFGQPALPSQTPRHPKLASSDLSYTLRGSTSRSPVLGRRALGYTATAVSGCERAPGTGRENSQSLPMCASSSSSLRTVSTFVPARPSSALVLRLVHIYTPCLALPCTPVAVWLPPTTPSHDLSRRYPSLVRRHLAQQSYPHLRSDTTVTTPAANHALGVRIGGTAA